MRQYLLLLLVFTHTTLLGQVNKNGIPFITNYTPETYKSAEQNWDVIQDNRGLVYFGNHETGILEYDGVSWRSILVDDKYPVRSLNIKNNGTIQVGGVGNFGYLQCNNGQLKYQSLVSDSISKLNFSDIWKILETDSITYFCNQNYLFAYNGSTVKQIDLPPGIVFSFYENNIIYIPNFITGLNFMQNDSIKPLLKGDFFSKKGVYTINVLNNNNLLIGTYPNGVFRYNTANGNTSPFFKNKTSNDFINDAQIYNCLIKDNFIYFGTIQNGLIILNTDGEILNHINEKHGLHNQIITNSTHDSFNNVWLALNNGIAKIEPNNGIKKIDKSFGIPGDITAIKIFNGKKYIGTQVGLFIESTDENGEIVFEKNMQIINQVFHLSIFNTGTEKSLLVGTGAGLFEIDKHNNIKNLDKSINPADYPDATNYVQIAIQSNFNQNMAYVGTSNGGFCIEKTNKRWVRKFELPIKAHILDITEASKDSLWVCSMIKKPILVTTSSDSTFVFDSIQGLPSSSQYFTSRIDNSIVFTTSKGLFEFNNKNNTFIPYKKTFNNYYIKNNIGIHKIEPLGNEIWLSAIKNNIRWVERILQDSTGQFFRDTLPFKRLPNEQFEAICHDTNNITWLGSSSGLFSFDRNFKYNTNQTFNTLIRKVKTIGDSVLFWGTNFEITNNGDTVPSLTQPKELILTLDYEFNDLTFEYAAPYFIEEQKTLYAYKLEGYNNSWSKWTNETKAVFTNLREGEYVFKAKAKNIYGFESSIAQYKFVLTPPWYRTFFAYGFYSIAAVVLMIVVVKLYTRRLEQEKIRLEGIVQERTAEIRQQNEILKEQKEEIEHQKEEITASIQYAQRIQKAIVPSEKLAECLLNEYFLLWLPRDIVSGDFWWLGEKDGYVVATAADCTGHGVPGAFMSMLGVSFLNEIVKQQNITNSNEILDKLRDKVKVTLGQENEESTNKDGMDIALLVIDYNKMQAQFSGAYNPLYLYRDGELIETKATRNPIGVYIKEKPFEQHIIDLQKDDVLYTFSDGFPDQFGGDKQKKYSTKRFKQLLLDIHTKPMKEQKQILNQELLEWRGPIEQVDDVIILGIKIS